VAFVQPAEERILTDAEKIARARIGPDIHCGYCGARNRADAANCRQCGGEMAAGEVRAAGAVLGAHRDQPQPPVACPTCGRENPAAMRHCRGCGAPLPQAELPTAPLPESADEGKGSGRMIMLIVGGIVLAIVAFIFFLTRSEETSSVVQQIEWERSIAIEALVPVTYEDWLDEIPNEGSVLSCDSQVRSTQNEPAPNAVEVCGTPVTVDQGSGFGEVVQECFYEIYADWCEYSVDEWQTVETVEARGPGLNAFWPEFSLEPEQREGERTEEYTIFFDEEGKSYRYQVSDPERAALFTPGSRWILSVNFLDAVLDAQPAP
jgi:ribosomal protein L40E